MQNENKIREILSYFTFQKDAEERGIKTLGIRSPFRTSVITKLIIGITF
jgi:hypothetical protein